MQEFILSILFNIPGIGAASGICYDNGRLLLISDNSNCIYSYDVKTAQLDKHAIGSVPVAEHIAKKDKPDYEAMAMADGKLYVFGSGSALKRNAAVVWDLNQTSRPEVLDLSNLYDEMRNISRISADDFNLEGATKWENKWYFFQRGNGPAGKNGVFTVSGSLLGDVRIKYDNVPLPDCNGIAATFTDAVAVGSDIYFIATAENSNSVYHDGEILGSIVGCLDPKTMTVRFTKMISSTHKFEGLALVSASDAEITFMLCEDSDSEVTESGIYELRLRLK